MPFKEGSVKGKSRIMRTRLKIAFMLTATTAIATSLFLTAPRAWAAESEAWSEAITTTDEHGRQVYVNDEVPVQKRPTQTLPPKRSSLVYWSSKESGWKPVASAGKASLQTGAAPAAEGCQ